MLRTWARPRLVTAAAALVVAAPIPARAHSPIEGIEGFYIGLVHPLSTPPQLLALLSLGLMLGLAWPAGAGPAWGIFAAALFAGLAAGAAGAPVMAAPPMLLVVAIAAATAAALFPGRGAPLRGAAAALCGLGIGLVSLPDPGPLRATLITVAGSVVGANALFLYAAGGVGLLRARLAYPVTVLALRVAASWTAAIAALMAALMFAPQGG